MIFTSATTPNIVPNSSGSSSSGLFVDLCAQLAPMASILLSLAPLPTIQNIRKNKSVGSLPLLPYTCMMANVMLWSTYGFLKNEVAVWLPNVVGFVLVLSYMASYIQFAPKHNKSSPTLPGSVQQHLAAIAAIAVVTATAAQLVSSSSSSNVTAADIVGRAAVLMCMAMFASPLVSLKAVLRDKSARSIPLPFTVCSIINCFCWSVAGIFKWRDQNITIPNVTGLFFGLVQMTLKLIYGDGRQDKREAAP